MQLGKNMPTQDLTNRVSIIETELMSLARNQNQLTDTVAKYITASEQRDTAVLNKIGEISDKVAGQGKPNWGALGTMFGAIVLILGWYVSGLINPIDTKITSQITNMNQLEERVLQIDLIQDNKLLELSK